MDSHPLEKKPTWWLLYTIGATLVGLVGLLETSVSGDATRLVLELGSVVTMFSLMLCWLRVNRGRIELAEARATRAHAFGLVIQVSAPGVKNSSKSPRAGTAPTNVA
jgi:hypothetical protein